MTATRSVTCANLSCGKEFAVPRTRAFSHVTLCSPECRAASRNATKRKRDAAKRAAERGAGGDDDAEETVGMDPVTCLGRTYTAEETEFLRALDTYKRVHKRPWPTACEIFAVVRGLGYERK